MTTYRGLDSAAVPGPVTRAAAKAQGVSWWGGYLGGPDAAAAWTAADFAAVRDDGFAVLPIYVPAQNASLGYPPGVAGAMASIAATAGVPRGCVLALDAEPVLAAYLGQNPSTVESLASALESRGYHLAVYGDSGAGPAVPGDVRWLAAWPGTRNWPSSLPAGDADWQWAGSGTSPVAGTDADLCDESLFQTMWGAPAAPAAPVATTVRIPPPSRRQVKMAGQWVTVQDAPIPLGPEGGGWLQFEYPYARVLGIVTYGDVRAWITGTGTDTCRLDVAGGPPDGGYVTVSLLLGDA